MGTQETFETRLASDFMADSEVERQEYLDETHVESTQFGAGRWAEEYRSILW